MRTLLTFLVLCGHAVAQDGIADPVAFEAYKQRLADRRHAALGIRQDMAIAAAEARRGNFTPLSYSVRVPNAFLVDPLGVQTRWHDRVFWESRRVRVRYLPVFNYSGY